jgi:hypothetical protein
MFPEGYNLRHGSMAGEEGVACSSTLVAEPVGSVPFDDDADEAKACAEAWSDLADIQDSYNLRHGSTAREEGGACSSTLVAEPVGSVPFDDDADEAKACAEGWSDLADIQDSLDKIDEVESVISVEDVKSDCDHYDLSTHVHNLERQMKEMRDEMQKRDERDRQRDERDRQRDLRIEQLEPLLPLVHSTSKTPLSNSG